MEVAASLAGCTSVTCEGAGATRAFTFCSVATGELSHIANMPMMSSVHATAKMMPVGAVFADCFMLSPGSSRFLYLHSTPRLKSFTHGAKKNRCRFTGLYSSWNREV